MDEVRKENILATSGKYGDDDKSKNKSYLKENFAKPSRKFIDSKDKYRDEKNERKDKYDRNDRNRRDY